MGRAAPSAVELGHDADPFMLHLYAVLGRRSAACLPNAPRRLWYPIVRGRVPITFGIGDSSTTVSIDLARHASQLGAAAVMLPPPYYFGHSSSAIQAHYLAVASSVATPLMIYDGGGGIELPVEMMAHLGQQAPSIKLAKLSTPKPAKVRSLRIAAPEMAVFCGDDNMVLQALTDGAVGMTIGSGNLQPDATAMIYNLHSAGNVSAARRLHSQRIAPAVNICGTSKSEYVRCFKEVLAAKRIISTPFTRLPLIELEPTRKEELFATMKDLGVL
jgi:4-hydroxy-tetrahydrodipicolinate synthase